MHIRDGTWEKYKISKEEYRHLRQQSEDSNNIYLVTMTAVLTNSEIADWIIESVTCRKTYEMIEYDDFLGHIPCGRTDFYAYRRKYYQNFKKILNGTKRRRRKI